ncbi:uncharacterized protein N7473_013209 [Penicillium subrubescens]|uniref:uncharacterized protein n=1 Tax=Penicillium subrubescens TaxID=1316194 RepID=UPI0025454CB9|nr:uncharacterized protein N7473_013194 [Penicillium subrubescens]XP_057002198.1 uncharacterized protein N7473_013209 [Penicillium subrubescens]KAJ5873635.1 hypothetical protein N7473_013194 [Penicillium subrubescens]KAJ5873650.1 hypothetical protein N7473_013209 [Penicillium subrubescens]
MEGLLSELFNGNWSHYLFRRPGLRRAPGLEGALFKGWTFDPNQIRDDNWGMVVKSLIYQSLNKVGLIPFEALVELSRGQVTPTLRDFLEEYELLYSQICSFYVKRPYSMKSGGHLSLMKEHLEDKTIGADPFIRTVVQDACDYVVNKHTRKRDLVEDLRHFITNPLRDQLHEYVPHNILLRRKKVLAVRLKAYISDASNMWDKPFDSSTTFLDEYLSLEPRALAERITKVDHHLYRKLKVSSFLEKGQDLQTLQQREINLTRSVMECLDTQILNVEQVFELAKHFCDMQNYLSMDAVQTGAESARLTPEIKQRLRSIANWEQQLNIPKPGLYPLARAAKCAVLWDNTQLAEKYIDLCVCYTLERLAETGTWDERIKNMEPPHTKTVDLVFGARRYMDGVVVSER